MNCIGTYDGTIFYNPANKFCIISVKTADQSVPAEARSNRRYKDHLIRFTAVGYEIPRTDAVELELDGEWAKGKYGVQLQVEQWREIVPRTKNGVEGYLASGLIKGIGPKTAADIVERFGVDTLDILEHQPERLLEIRGITENKLEDIKASYAENRMLQGIMTLLAPFKITPKTALKIYQYFGPTSVEILEKSPFELCQISGFGFRRVDAIVQKSGGDLHDPMRIKGAVFCALDEGKSKRGHLYISSEELEKSALKLLNEKIPVPELRLHQQEVRDMLQLELPYQKLWFRLRHPQGRMKLTTLRITEQLAIMEARVYLDRSDAEPISSYISQHSAEEGTDYVQAAQDEALSAALSDAGFGLQFADVAVDSTGKVFGSSIPLSGTAPIQQPMPNAAQRPVEAPGAALRQSGGEVHARPERAPQNAVEGRNAPARPAPIQKPAAKPVQNEQPPVSPVQPVVQQMVAEEKENMDTLPAGKVEENAPNMELPVPSREVTLDSSPKQDDVSEQPTASVFQSDEPEELPVAPVVQQEAPDQPMAPSYTESTPVEDILKVMTFEEAQNVVVDSGLSKGKTMATVAKERPVSLKFYLTPGNKSTNNIVRAAAQIMLDGMAAQKAG